MNSHKMNIFEKFDTSPSLYTASLEGGMLKYSHIGEPSSYIVKRPLEQYNSKDELIGYTWNYGDSVLLEFETTGTVTFEEDGVYMEAKDYLEGKFFHLDIYDFRYELVFHTEVPAHELTHITIIYDEKDFTNKLRLTRGNYKMKLTLIEKDDDENVIETHTMIEPNDCLITIL